MPDSVVFLLLGRDKFDFKSDFAGFGNADCLAELLELPQDIWIEVSELLDGLPSENFIFTWRNAADREMAVFVRDGSLEQIGALSKTVRHHHGLNAGYRLGFLINKRSFDLSGSGTEDNFECAGDRSRNLERDIHDIRPVETSILHVEVWRNMNHEVIISGKDIVQRECAIGGHWPGKLFVPAGICRRQLNVDRLKTVDRGELAAFKADVPADGKPRRHRGVPDSRYPSRKHRRRFGPRGVKKPMR